MQDINNPKRDKVQPGTYFMKENDTEIKRLLVQEALIKTNMGGILPEQPEPEIFRRVLDIGCGPGGWCIDMADTYPTLSRVSGIDINPKMIDYARGQAQVRKVADRVEFHVMDALMILEFPADSFDLVNLRLGVSFMRTWDWPKMFTEMLRVCRPGGVIRLTEGDIGLQGNVPPALSTLFGMLQQAFYGAGHLFEAKSTGLTEHLQKLMIQHGCERVQKKVYAGINAAGSPELHASIEDMAYAFSSAKPFIMKWTDPHVDYDTLYQQALIEMSQPDFQMVGSVTAFWGYKPHI